jgi:TolB protein
MRLRARSEIRAIFAAAVVVLPMLACKEAVSPDLPAAISITVKVAGTYPYDGVQLEVDGRPMTLLLREPSVVVRGLSPGTHTVALVGLAADCQNDGANPVTVETSSANLSGVEFRVSCFASTGAIAIAVSVSGSSRPLQLQTLVDSASRFYGYITVAGNTKTVLYGSFSGGVHVVTLLGVPQYCAGERSQSVNVKTGAVITDTAVASFSFTCDPPQVGADPAASIAFERDGYVTVVKESGGFPVAVAEGAAPAWSANGEEIAFQRANCNDWDCERDIWLMQSTGDNRRPFIADQYYDDYDAAISPDGTDVAFIRFWIGPDQTYLAVRNLQGGTMRLLSIWHPVSSPTWSPDGTQIAFVCWGGLTTFEDLCVVRTDRSCTSYFASQCGLPDPVRLTNGSGAELDPSWSPDGRRIAFTLSCAGGFGNVPPNGPCPAGVSPAEPFVAVIDVTTREVTRIIAGHDPAWSPDGTQLVFAGNTSSPGLRVYSFASGSVRNLTDYENDRSPSWR